jgi:hypothetical protein
MKTGIVEFKFQGGTRIKIKGSADFVATVTKVVLELGEGKSSEHVQEGELKTQRDPIPNRLEGLPPIFSPEWQGVGHSCWNDSGGHIRLLRFSSF